VPGAAHDADPRPRAPGTVRARAPQAAPYMNFQALRFIRGCVQRTVPPANGRTGFQDWPDSQDSHGAVPKAVAVIQPTEGNFGSRLPPILSILKILKILSQFRRPCEFCPLPDADTTHLGTPRTLRMRIREDHGRLSSPGTPISVIFRRSRMASISLSGSTCSRWTSSRINVFSLTDCLLSSAARA